MPSILHVSDLHFSQVEPGSADALLRAVERLAPDLVVVSGDLTLAGKRSEFRDAAYFLAKIAQPTLIVPGNHDIPAFDVAQRFLRPLGRYQRYISRERVPVHQAEGMCVVGLNTARPWDLSWNWSHGRFSTWQIEEADRVFAGAASCPFKCLVIHHPFFLPDGMRGFRAVGRAAQMLDVLGRRRVDLVLAGHLHKGFWRAREHTTPDGAFHALVVQASTATSHRRRNEPNAMNHLLVDEGRLVLTTWVREDVDFVPGEVVRFERGANGWNAVGTGAGGADASP